jgi:nitrogen fixation protein FixH
MSDFKPMPGEFTGRHMLIIMIAFFGVIIGVNVLMATVASRSWTGLVVKNSYVASQNFNAEMEAARKQARLGWSSQVQVDANAVSARISDRDGPLAALTVELKLSRPTNEASDQSVMLAETAAGRYAAPVDLNPGVWNAELIALSPSGDKMREYHRFIIPARAGS